MTKEMQKQLERLIAAVFSAAAIIGLALGCVIGGFDRHAAYVATACTAAYLAGYALLRVILWLDGERHV